jgi:hypothetical protein
VAYPVFVKRGGTLVKAVAESFVERLHGNLRVHDHITVAPRERQLFKEANKASAKSRSAPIWKHGDTANLRHTIRTAKQPRPANGPCDCTVIPVATARAGKAQRKVPTGLRSRTGRGSPPGNG